MKKARILFVSTALVAGLTTAFAFSTKATFDYVNLNDSGTYTKVASFNVGKCITTPATKVCSYQSAIDFGPTATQAQLAGQPTSGNIRIYKP